MEAKTTDLCDTHGDALRVLEEPLSDFGGLIAFGGPVHTLRAYEDNSLVRAALSEPGQGRVLVVDGGGSRRCALVGDVLAAAALANGWAGVIVNGCIRDCAAVAALDLGVMALDVQPRRSDKHAQGVLDVPLLILGARVRPGDWAYADEDGVVFSQHQIPA